MTTRKGNFLGNLFNRQALALGLCLFSAGLTFPVRAADATPTDHCQQSAAVPEISFSERLQERLRMVEIGDVRFYIEKERYDDAMEALRKKDKTGQVEALSTPGVVWKLAKNNLAGAVFDIIDKLEPAVQEKILATDNVVWGLADGGQAACVMDMINGFDQAAQRDILLAFGTIVGLADNGEAGRVMVLIQSLDHETRKTILEDPGIVEELSRHGYGQGRSVDGMRGGCILRGPLHGGTVYGGPLHGGLRHGGPVF